MSRGGGYSKGRVREGWAGGVRTLSRPVRVGGRHHVEGRTQVESTLQVKLQVQYTRMRGERKDGSISERSFPITNIPCRLASSFMIDARSIPPFQLDAPPL